MSPRANRRRADLPRQLGGASAAPRTEEYAGREWSTRRVRGSPTGRAYRCPGCQQDVPAAGAHVVVWPADGIGGLDERRHWHTRCWAARATRPPLGSWR